MRRNGNLCVILRSLHPLKKVPLQGEETDSAPIARSGAVAQTAAGSEMQPLPVPSCHLANSGTELTAKMGKTGQTSSH
ncbi:hypothetical protein CBR_g979 [Chara braunii]|uniref:Uncharacterized protein n=1 Tax=Chara braunii TaxID=69332 RepID=A0A388KCU4_CHABU|nr:hypothetical protein CBR_g979 [Chara braunii]|eukprot:GBG67859.1 hypothetical protein CBR_g979 [Chara braunii]